MENATKYISAAIEGGYKPCFFRRPYGSYNSTTINLARNRGMSVVKWSRNTKDWAAPPSLSTSFQKTIVANATSPLSSHPNVIMQYGGPSAYRQNTVDSLQRIITFYKSRGYKFSNPAGERPSAAGIRFVRGTAPLCQPCAWLRREAAWTCAKLLHSRAATNVHVRSSHITHFATRVSHQERTCTCVPDSW
jgi:hypothetical protein